jgi:serine/threonine-protein kinase
MKGKLLGGRYQVVEILATGGFGQTFVAEDTHRPGNPQCVVKHLKPASINSGFLQNARRLFQSEAETLEKLGNHNQIPRLLAYFEENQEFYLVQEFIQGHTLSAELQAGKPWSESKVYQFLQEILNLLIFVHGHRVIHRDIKPDNLIRRQRDGKLVLVDFGSVKQAWTQVVTAQGQTSATFANSPPATIAIGTPGYMPTEQGRGKPRPNSDIYALGMIAIQALTGVNPTQLIEESDNGEIQWQHQAQVSERLAAVLSKMVRYHFKNRYQSAAEALQALLLVHPHQQEHRDSDAEIPIRQSRWLQPTAVSVQPSQEKQSSQDVVLITAISSSNTPINSTTISTSGVIHPEPSPLLAASTSSATQPTALSPLKPQAPQPNQKVIPSPPDSLEARMDLKEHVAIPVIHNQHYLRIGAAITAVLMSVVAGYGIYWQPRPNEKTLEQIETLRAAGKYEKCINQAATTPQDSHLYTAAQALLHECQLAQAKKFAAAQNFKAAIAEASKIPQAGAYHQEAQQLVNQWSETVLEIARNEYESGKLNEAIAITNAIPATSRIYPQTQAAIKHWQGEWKENTSYFKAAQTALNEGKWQNALSFGHKVTDTPYWKQRLEPIIQKAKSKVAESKTAVTNQPIQSAQQSVGNATIPLTPTPTKQVGRSTQRRVTRATTRPPTRAATRRIGRSTQRRVTRATTRPPIRAFVRSTGPANRWVKRTTSRRATYNTPKRVTRPTAKRFTRSATRKQSYRLIKKKSR